MTQAIEHSAHLTAFVAKGFNLDGRGLEAKTKFARLLSKCASQNSVLDLGHSPAITAHQELPAVLIFGAVTSQERIQRIQAMYESGLLQELQGAVNGGRGGFLTVFSQLRENLIGADRLVLPPHDLKDTPSQRGQVDLLRCTYLFGRRDRPLNTARVVMWRTLSIRCFRHWVIL